MLQRRKAKKEKLQGMLITLGDQKLAEDDSYQQKMLQIHAKEQEDKQAIEQEMEVVKKEQIQEIQRELQQKRLKLLSESEKKLEAFKRK